MFGHGWPAGVPLQAHVMRDDQLGEPEIVEEVVRQSGGQLYRYDVDAHLFTDRSLDAHDPVVATLVMRRTLAFLASLE